MRIEINPRSLLNLEHICEVLYKLHPSVLNDLIEMQRSLGGVLGTINTDNMTLEEREFLLSYKNEKDYSSPTLEDKGIKVTHKTFNNREEFCDFLNKLKEKHKNAKILFDKKHEMAYYGTENQEEEKQDKINSSEFCNLRKYIQLDTDEYIPMKISVQVEDPVLGRKVKELVEALEKTRAPEQFFLHKKEIDEDAYFAEGYGLTMNEEQKKELDDFLEKKDLVELKKLLREKIYIRKINI